MGALADGTLCVYCGVNEAEDIPDGYAGAICFICPDGSDGCSSLTAAVVDAMRLTRFANFRFRVLPIDVNHPLNDPTIAMLVASFVIRM